MFIHFIAIGGSAMHNLAIALHKKGYNITGSDDEIFEPSKSHLQKYGLLPEKTGWYPEKIDKHIIAIILGMHARRDNPELIKAQELGLKIYSYPEFIYEQSKNKLRVVIAGSHGKTTITGMIMHVLNYFQKDFDYLVGAQLEGFETMVKLTDTAQIIILEGDEYLASAIDLRPKFHIYKPNIALISGIAWDHINVFPSFEKYIEQFRIFINQITDNGILFFCTEDNLVNEIVGQTTDASLLKKIPYSAHPHIIKDSKTYLLLKQKEIPLNIFGEHNMQNINGARLVCNQLGISDEQFYEAIQTYKGASRRLQIIGEGDNFAIFYDFAHSPSKLKASVSAVKRQYPHRQLIACIELHTFSSLNKNFLKHYKDTMNDADIAIIYFNPQTIAHKKLEMITKEEVLNAFAREDLKIYTNSSELVNDLSKISIRNKNLLIMTSGNFDGVDIKALAKNMTQQIY